MELKVALFPGQITLGVELTVMLGPGSTVTVKSAEFVQEPTDPAAVNVVVTVGVKTMGLPELPTGYQVKLLAPKPTKVSGVPGHMTPTGPPIWITVAGANVV